MNKATLRETYLQKRKSLSQNELQKRNRLIRLQFFHFFNGEQVKNMHVFLPIEKQNEVDTLSIVQEMWIRMPKVKIVISKSNFDTMEMDSYLYTKGTILKENKWGIPEPVEAELFNEQDIDMVLVPLVAFDNEGHRVGYGKGFYDRFLKKCRPDTIKVGMSLEPPVEKITDTSEHDVMLDYCVTPREVYHFQH